tara:strand:- start:1096 stop:1557 length:462 start_codon:yes stop_codon:yes gene_type:complete
MSELDRREEWMGLGIVLSELRMKTWVENRSDSKLGMRVQKRITWRSLFKSGTEGQRRCVAIFLRPFDMELKENYYDSDSITKWLMLLERLDTMYSIRHSITDRVGWHMIEWVMDNPTPKEWKEFIEWVSAYDEEQEMISDYINNDSIENYETD